jgi:hypothetical protein
VTGVTSRASRCPTAPLLVRGTAGRASPDSTTRSDRHPARGGRCDEPAIARPSRTAGTVRRRASSLPLSLSAIVRCCEHAVRLNGAGRTSCRTDRSGHAPQCWARSACRSGCRTAGSPGHHSEGADDRTAEEEVAAADADSLETCSAIAAAISREVDRLPRSASATTASASEGSTLAATVTLRAWFTSLALLTTLVLRLEPAATLEDAMAKVPPTPNRAAICANCGWTNYPQPVLIPDRPGLLDWATPPTCSYCGEPLEPAAPRYNVWA